MERPLPNNFFSAVGRSIRVRELRSWSGRVSFFLGRTADLGYFVNGSRVLDTCVNLNLT